jgi:hypothetical protein
MEGWELIERGYHREAMFWIAVTHSRCHKVLSRVAPEEMKQSFRNSYRDLGSDLGVPSFTDIRQRYGRDRANPSPSLGGSRNHYVSQPRNRG